MKAPEAARRGRKPKFNDRRMEVLRAAARVFADRGYSQATLEDIAGELSMTRAALYYYADSKDELLRACARVAREALGEALVKAEALALGLEQLRFYFREHVAFGCNDFGRCFLLLDGHDVAEALRTEQYDWRRERNRRIEAMILRGMEDGSLAKGDAILARRLLVASMNAVPLWAAGGKPAAIQKAADAALDVLVSGFAPRG